MEDADNTAADSAQPDSGLPDIEIPGIEIEHEIARSEMSVVYLGLDEDDEPVAVKILRPAYATDAHFRQRFGRMCAMHQQLSHPNIVNLHAYKATGDFCYQIMEYLPGGNLGERLEQGIHVQALIKIVKDIARALDYVHALEIVHKDVKPENILFGHESVAVLTDFGIAQYMETTEANNVSSLTHRGTVLGTPEYMSPEQAAGRVLDGRSDLYSLGVLLYRIITGSVPYEGDAAVTVGVKHLQAPVPRLPGYLAEFQPIIDQALAKKPEQRFQSGQEFVAALDQLRHDLTIESTTFKTRPVNTQEIRALSQDVLSTPRDPIRQEKRSRRRRRLRAARMSALLLMLAASLAGAGYYFYEQGLLPTDQILSQLGIGEDPQLTSAWGEARSIHQDPNQGLSSIVAAYRRVLGVDPDHDAALAEVAGLANEWKQSIDEALRQDNLQQAEARLNEARTVFPDDADWLQLDIRLQNRVRAERIMTSTQALLTSHGLSDQPSAAAATQAFQEVLRLAPGHAQARAALNEIASHYVTLATVAAQTGDVTDAIGMLERATSADPNMPALDDVRQLISQATTVQTAIEDLLQQARRYRTENQLISPPGENAAELYHRVLATDPDNVIAAQGLDEVAAQATATANALLNNGDLAAVDILVNQAAAAGLSDANVNEIRSRLEDERGRQTLVVAKLAEARQLMALGYLTAPADQNAVAKLREVQQADPQSAEALALLRECAQRLAEAAQEAYAFGLAAEAEQYLDLALTITPEAEEWIALRNSWERSADGNSG